MDYEAEIRELHAKIAALAQRIEELEGFPQQLADAFTQEFGPAGASDKPGEGAAG